MMGDYAQSEDGEALHDDTNKQRILCSGTHGGGLCLLSSQLARNDARASRPVAGFSRLLLTLPFIYAWCKTGKAAQGNYLNQAMVLARASEGSSIPCRKREALEIPFLERDSEGHRSFLGKAFQETQACPTRNLVRFCSIIRRGNSFRAADANLLN